MPTAARLLFQAVEKLTESVMAFHSQRQNLKRGKGAWVYMFIIKIKWFCELVEISYEMNQL